MTEQTSHEATQGSDYKWYAIQTMNGHEKKVHRLLEEKILADTRPAEDRPVRQALVPVESVEVVKKGEKVKIDRLIYPGYVLVEMVPIEEAIHLVSGIAGVTRFMSQGRLPQALRKEEVDRLMGIEAAEEVRVDLVSSYTPGQMVAIISGPFMDINGTVLEVFEAKRKAKVSVPMLGRETTIMVDYNQLHDSGKPGLSR